MVVTILSRYLPYSHITVIAGALCPSELVGESFLLAQDIKERETRFLNLLPGYIVVSVEV